MNWVCGRIVGLTLLAGTLALAGPTARAEPAAAPLEAAVVNMPGQDAAVRGFHSVKGQPIWSDGQAEALNAALARSDAHAIDTSDARQAIAAAPAGRTRDLALTGAALAYANALANGLTDPEKLFPVYTLRRNHVNVVAGLHAALRKGDVGAWLDSLPPGDAEYQALSAAFLDQQSLAGKAEAAPIPGGPAIGPGFADPRVADIAAALGRAGFPPAGKAASAATSTPELVTAIKAFQHERGLDEDGIVGPNVLAALNETAADRARRLAVNLERRRWLDRTPPAARIDVNTAAATLSFFQGDKVEWTTRVAPGSADWATPTIQASFDRLVVNPPWRVPADIVRKEIDPKGPAYLRKNHMTRVGGDVVQAPGPWAALGQVKFDLQDPYAIYLHDTPSKALFERGQRHLSHGCVRVEGAVGFARRLADQSGKAAEFDALVASGKTGVVPLAAPIPVRLLYATAFAGDDGRIIYRSDVYGSDAKAAQALRLTPMASEDLEPVEVDPIGP